jgi:hypothetical protein
MAVLLYGCETWYIIRAEEHRLWKFRKKGGKGNMWTQEGGSDRRGRELHNKELHNLSSANITIVIK